MDPQANRFAEVCQGFGKLTLIFEDPSQAVMRFGGVGRKPQRLTKADCGVIGRSEERRVGKECRSWGWREHSSRRRHTRLVSDWSSDVCSSDLPTPPKRITAWDGSASEPLRGSVSGLR